MRVGSGRVSDHLEMMQDRVNSMEPYAWLEATFEAIAVGHPNVRTDDLLPGNFASSSS